MAKFSKYNQPKRRRRSGNGGGSAQLTTWIANTLLQEQIDKQKEEKDEKSK